MRILVVEDETSLARAITELLKKNHYEAEAVHNGTDACGFLLSGSYDADILDIMLPGKDGIEVLREVRDGGAMLPILLLTAKSSENDKVLGLDSGANDYLTKPFSVRELMARIRAMTRPLEQQTSIITYGNVSLNRINFELSTPYGNYRLASKEYQMMELFIANPNMLFSTERLLEKVWGYETEVQESTVWVYVSYLRKKLRSLHANVEIRALRYAGYSLEEIK